MTAATHEDVLVRLRTVRDPCSVAMAAPMDIWEMGLVDGLEVGPDEVRVTLVLTDTSCVFFRDIRAHIVDALADLDGVERVTVEVNAEVLWTPDRMNLVWS